jgi:hypothetical protein
MLPIALHWATLTGNFKDRTESIDKYYIKEEGLPNLMKEKIKLEDLMQLYNQSMGKAFSLRKNDRPESRK